MCRIDLEDWLNEGQRRFGPNPLDWKFKCPLCGTPQSARDFLDQTRINPDAIEDLVGVECLSRHTGGKCFYGKAAKRVDEIIVVDPNGREHHWMEFDE